MRRLALLWFSIALLIASQFGFASSALPGGTTSVSRQDRNAFLLPSANLSAERQLDFRVGSSFFRNPWVSAPASTTARDGLGPLFNTNACINCHVRDGRGHPPEADARNSAGMLVRISLPPETADPLLLKTIGTLAEPTYGGQLQDMALPGVAPEARIRVRYQEHSAFFNDGHEVRLRRPELLISQLGYGPLHPDSRLSARIAPTMIGLGLLEAIDAEDILAQADPEDRNADGIRGQANWVWDIEQQSTVLGRFGWKASQPSLDQQNAHALANDLGLTSVLIPHDDCRPQQIACLQQPNGGEPEVSDNIRQAILTYTRHLAVPMRRQLDEPAVQQGEQLFHQAGCANCHTPSYTTRADASDRELANQTIYPYTDLLLHDMGPDLADQHSEFQAAGNQWRTPALWGLGLTQTVSGHTQMLHDGRARNALEAILWHGGEAASAKRHVLTYTAEQRTALLAFLNSL